MGAGGDERWGRVRTARAAAGMGRSHGHTDGRAVGKGFTPGGLEGGDLALKQWCQRN